jgi:nucleotide-binding universal stress UspA family protein
MNADGRTSSPSDPAPARIVVGVDDSPHSHDALAWAAAEARLRATTLEVVYAMFYRSALLEQFPDELARERSILDRAVARATSLEPTIEVTGRMVEPPAAKALVEISEGADLLVVGSRGLGGFMELELGSVSHQCARHARCPVVVVRPRRKNPTT